MSKLQQLFSKPAAPSPNNPSVPKFKARGSVFNPRTVTAPIAAVVMAGLLYTYSVTSIRAAKRNAQLHREADGGQLDMRKESLRRHGVLDRVEGTTGYELFSNVRAGGKRGLKEEARNETGYMGEKQAKNLGTVEQEEEGRPRTEVEGGLEGYKGRGNLAKKMKEIREGG